MRTKGTPIVDELERHIGFEMQVGQLKKIIGMLEFIRSFVPSGSLNLNEAYI